MVRQFILVIALWLIATYLFPAFGQEQFSENKRSTVNQPDTTNTASVSFDKSLNTYHWVGSLWYTNAVGPLSFDVRERFLSTLIRADHKSITDDQMVAARFHYRLIHSLSAASLVSSSLLWDNRSIGSSIGNASSHAWYLGFSYQPFEHVTIEPLAGARIDNQLDQHDHGPTYALSVATDSLNSAGYTGSLNGSFQYDDIKPRILETHNATLTLQKQFFEQTDNALRLNYYRNRRDFYLAADSALMAQHSILYNIESRAENLFIVSDSLRYTVSEAMGWIMYGNISTREITRATRYKNIEDPSQSPLNTVIDELKLEGSIRGFFRFSRSLRSWFAFSYLERDEKHQLDAPDLSGTSLFKRFENIEEQKNNHARRATLASATDWFPSSSDTIAVSASINGLRYDTPSSENDDDRDEVWYLISLSTRHGFNQHLNIELSMDANLSHIVYLFASRSADNNWNRIIRLAPSVTYRPWQCFSTMNTFEVLANYTVYDFELTTALLRSYAFRQFAWIDSTRYQLTARLALHWFSHFRLYERGEFQWNTFSEKPINYFEEKLYLGTIRYAMSPGLLFSLGIRYFSLKRFGYSGIEKVLANYYRSVGPTSSIEMNIHDRTVLSVRGWYERQTQTTQPTSASITIMASLNVRI
jgi:hypothetical protein